MVTSNSWIKDGDFSFCNWFESCDSNIYNDIKSVQYHDYSRLNLGVRE